MLGEQYMRFGGLLMHIYLKEKKNKKKERRNKPIWPCER